VHPPPPSLRNYIVPSRGDEAATGKSNPELPGTTTPRGSLNPRQADLTSPRRQGPWPPVDLFLRGLLCRSGVRSHPRAASHRGAVSFPSPVQSGVGASSVSQSVSQSEASCGGADGVNLCSRRRQIDGSKLFWEGRLVVVREPEAGGGRNARKKTLRGVARPEQGRERRKSNPGVA
jgi:hypothetical protein